MNKSWAIGILVVGVLVLVSGLAFFMVRQETLGNAPTLSDCNTILQDKCVSGYACTSCARVTLPYYLQFSSGSTNIVYTADCVYGSSNTGSGHTACGGSNIVSHAKSHCYSGSVYWFNSVGSREDLKSSCTYGCEDYTLDSARCITGTNVGGTCFPDGSKLCTSATYVGSQFYCDTSKVVNCPTGCSGDKCNAPFCIDSNTLCKNYGVSNNHGFCFDSIPQNCPTGCSNGACSTCSNQCASNGLTECVSSTTFRTCSMSGSCLKWFNAQNCVNGQTCNSNTGKCDNVVPPIIPPSTCTVKSECINDNQYKITLDDCSTKIVSCGDSEQCSGSGVCEAVVIPPVVPSCDGVTCDSYCASDFTAYTQGSCSDGVCTYGSIVAMSPACLPNNSTVNCTSDLYGVEPCGSGDKQLIAKCVNGNLQYIVYANNQCEPKTFLQMYGLWIAGGVFLLCLVIFIVNFVPKQKGRRK